MKCRCGQSHEGGAPSWQMDHGLSFSDHLSFSNSTAGHKEKALLLSDNSVTSRRRGSPSPSTMMMMITRGLGNHFFVESLPHPSSEKAVGLEELMPVRWRSDQLRMNSEAVLA